MAPKWDALRWMTDQDLIDGYDSISKSAQVGLSFYREEATRRGFERSSAAAHELARASLEDGGPREG